MLVLERSVSGLSRGNFVLLAADRNVPVLSRRGLRVHGAAGGPRRRHLR